jgi:hypothetical protein
MWLVRLLKLVEPLYNGPTKTIDLAQTPASSSGSIKKHERRRGNDGVLKKNTPIKNQETA